MRIHFSPQRRNDKLVVFKQGDVLTVNSAAFDFTSIPDGGKVPDGEVPCDWILGPVERVDGELRLTLRLPYGSTPSQAVAFPQPLVDPPDGPLTIPSDPEPQEESSNVDA